MKIVIQETFLCQMIFILNVEKSHHRICDYYNNCIDHIFLYKENEHA